LYRKQTYQGLLYVTINYFTVFKDNKGTYKGEFISLSGTFKLGSATTKMDTTERNITIGRESLQVKCVAGAMLYYQVSLTGSSHDKTWCEQGIRKHHVPWNLPIVMVQRRYPIKYHTEPPMGKTIHEL
jgi:hypothetical protein